MQNYLVFLLLVICSCVGDKSRSKESLKIEVVSSIEEGYDSLFNHSKDYLVCYKQKKGTVKNPITHVRLVVVDVVNEQIIYRPSESLKSFIWENDSLIRFRLQKGYVDDKSDVYYFDTRSRKKIDDYKSVSLR
ncbi:MAG: hypothetical protein OCD76_05985 [Reichenbachiella sp.]